MKRTIANALLLALSLTLSASILAQQESKKVTNEQRESMVSNYQALKSRVDNGKKVRVIVWPKRNNDAGNDQGAQRSSQQASQQAQVGLANAMANKNLNPKRRLKSSGTLVYEVDAEQLEDLINSGLVESIQEDGLSRPQLQQSIPLIGGNYTHDAGFNGSGYAVAILDTGVQASHPAFEGRVVEQACFSSNSPSSDISSACPNGGETEIGGDAGVNCTGASGCHHGTHVAGIAAGNNGAAPGATIVAVQVFSIFGPDSSYCRFGGSCVLAFQSDQVAALEWINDSATTPNIAAVNLSLASSRVYANPCDSDIRKPAIDNLLANNIATVIASGNESSTDGVSSPGCISSAITVGATDKADDMWFRTNRNHLVDLLAPGVEIWAPFPTDGFAGDSGTSMAAPHVAGAFAVLNQVNDVATVDEIESTLKNTGVSIVDTYTGSTYPRLDLYSSHVALRHRPFADIDQLTYSIMINQEHEFTANGSSNPSNQPLQYTWDFNDGSVPLVTSQPSISYTYNEMGTYQLDLVVNNGFKDSEPDYADVTVYDPAVITVIVTSLLL